MLQISRIILPAVTIAVGALWLIPVNNGLPSDAPPPAGYSAADPARLGFSWQGTTLQLQGHTASAFHEHELLRVAARYFPDASPQTEFIPLGTAPGPWQASSLAVLEALAAVQSGSAMLSDNAVSIRGVVTPAWHEAARRLRASLPATIELDIDMRIVKDTIDARALCERAFSEYRTGSVQFEESTTTLRDSARLALDKAVSLANTCRESIISITGHTDSSGPEAWNRELSVARANAVADYLEKSGVARERLLTFGKGSSEPLASNSSRYARSLNRRIEIRFSYGG